MIHAMTYKFLLVALLVGPGGGSLSKIESFRTLEECRLAQAETMKFLQATNEEAHKVNAAVSENVNCLPVPDDRPIPGGGK